MAKQNSKNQLPINLCNSPAEQSDKDETNGWLFVIGIGVGGLIYKLYDMVRRRKEPLTIASQPGRIYHGDYWKNMGKEEEAFVYQRLDSEFKCCLTLEVMNDPVILQCGHSFDRESLEVIIKSCSACPLCRFPMQRFKLITNFALKNLIYKEVKKLRAEYIFSIIETNSNN